MIIILPRQARGKHGNTLKKKAFCAERPLRPDVWQRPCEHGHDGRLDPRYEKEKRTFCTAIFILKMIILPRQARDKHSRENHKRSVFLQATCASRCGLRINRLLSFLPSSPFSFRLVLTVDPSLSWQIIIDLTHPQKQQLAVVHQRPKEILK